MRKLAAFALSFSAAVFTAQYLLPRQLWLPVGAFCALFSLAALLYRAEKRLRLLLIALGLAAGFLWCRGYDAVFYAPAQDLDGRTVRLEGAVTDWPQAGEYGVSVPVRVHTAGKPGVAALLYAGAECAALTPGDEISAIAACRLAERTGSGEEITYYTARGVFLVATVYGELTVQKPAHIPARYLPRFAAGALKECVASVFPADTAPFMTALLTGDRTGLSDAAYTALRRTGVAHVVAVSGMHVSLLAAMPGALASLLPGARRRRFAAAAGITLSFLFAALVGNTPSVLRAAFLCACMQLAPLLGRENDTPTALSAVLLLLLLQNPRSAANVSLQLSFAAVAGLYLFAGPLYRRWTARLPEKSGIAIPARFLLGILSASAGATLLTLPLAAYYFNMVSLIAPLANLAVLPLVLLAFPAGVATAGIAMISPGPGAFLAALVSVPLRLILFLTAGLSRIPFAAVTLNSVYYRIWLLFCYGVICLYLLWRGEKKRPLLPACAMAAVLLAAMGLSRWTANRGDLTVSVLNVGQGQSVLLYSQGFTALADCGGSLGQSAGDIAADRLQSLGENTLDFLVLTHYDADHMNGVDELLERLKVSTLVLPDVSPEDGHRLDVEALAARQGASVRYVTETTGLTLGKAELTVFPPQGGAGDNENGLTVLGSAGAFDVLITGDMNAETEARLLKHNRLPDIELYVVGHHGSGYSSSEALLHAVTPELAVISVGYNSYGHPAPETLERLTGDHIAVYRTDRNGTVTVTAP